MKKKMIGLYILTAVIALIYWFVETPNLNPLYPDGATFWCVIITVCILIAQLRRFNIKISLKRETIAAHGPVRVEKNGNVRKLPVIIIGAVWCALLLVHLFSTPLFHADTYRDQIGVPQVKHFEDDVQIVDTSQIPIVDQALAAKLAEKKLGEKPSLGSQVDLGEPTIQQVDGKLVWVVPLHHSGFFKWLFNMEGTPGYIVVSATDMQDVTYVDSPLVKIHPNAFFMDKLSRRVRIGAGMFRGITDYSFELDDSGQPYYVVTTFHYLRGFALPEADGILLVNATTGKTERYDMAHIPKWVDRVQPETFIMNQINNRGKYIHGVFNFSNFEKFQTSPSENIVYNNGRCYLFTGITSVGADESAIGIMMVDLVTKETVQYNIPGATENAAMKSAEGKVQDLKYKAAYPILLNVQSKPTYFMTLKDAEGLVKQYAFVSVESYDLVGVGETIDDARRNYEKALGAVGGTNQQEEKKTITVDGKIVRIAGEFDGSQVQYRLIVDTMPDMIFTVTADKSEELALTKEGDEVSVTYYEGSKGVVKATAFDNKVFSQQ